MAEKMTVAQFKSRRAKGTKRVKNAKVTWVDGIKFHSKREAKRYSELAVLERAGHISNLELQVKFQLNGENGPILTPTGRHMQYIADFRYVDWRLGGIWVVEDAKGYQTDLSKIKLAIMAAQGTKVVLS